MRARRHRDTLSCTDFGIIKLFMFSLTPNYVLTSFSGLDVDWIYGQSNCWLEVSELAVVSVN